MEYFLSAIGVIVFISLMAFVIQTATFRWRQLAHVYGAPWPTHFVGAKLLDTIIIRGEGVIGANYFFGANYFVSMRVTKRGLCMRFVPFGLFNPAIEIPFAELKAEKIFWYLNTESWALTGAQANGFKIIITWKMLDWITSHTTTWNPQL